MEMHTCACCGQSECDIYDDFHVCPVCGWAYDIVQEDDPDYEGGCNLPSLNQAKAEWKKTKT